MGTCYRTVGVLEDSLNSVVCPTSRLPGFVNPDSSRNLLTCPSIGVLQMALPSSSGCSSESSYRGFATLPRRSAILI